MKWMNYLTNQPYTYYAIRCTWRVRTNRTTMPLSNKFYCSYFSFRVFYVLFYLCLQLTLSAGLRCEGGTLAREPQFAVLLAVLHEVRQVTEEFPAVATDQDVRAA